MSQHNTMQIHDIDLPWNKLARIGPEGMRDEELLAIALKNGYGRCDVIEKATTVLRKHPVQTLLDMPARELEKIKGIGKTKAALLIAIFELAKRGLNQGLGLLPSISQPADAVTFLSDIKDQKKEYFIALFLNARNQILHRETVSVGSLNASLVHPREVFAPAIGSCAASLILAHNHPSGDPTPSREDIELTRRMVQAGEIMGIEILDHLIIGSQRFLSMKEANVF